MTQRRSLLFWLLVGLLLLGLFAWQQRGLAAATPAESPAALQLSPPSGFYAESVEVVLQTAVSSTPNSTILYTRDGRTPTPENSTVYEAPIFLEAATGRLTVIRAREQFANGELGAVAEAIYAVGIEADLPILSLIVEPDDLYDAERGIYANPFERGIAWERPVHATFIEENGEIGFDVLAGLRIHGGFTRTYDKKSFRLYFRRAYGVGRLQYPLFAPETPALSEAEVAVPLQTTSFDQIVIHSGGQDSPQPAVRWGLMRSQLVAQLAFQMDGYASRSRPVLLFINGESWGIYYLRERINSDFLADNLQIPQADLLDTPHLAETAAPIAGSRAHWDHLLDFLENNDLTEAESYAYVQTQVDIANFIDYTLLQIYSANYDWPQHNVIQFRPQTQGGRWHWIFWDNDFGFALDADSQADLDMINQALKLDRENRLTRQDVLLLRKLLENEQFRATFISRAANLLNGALAPDAVITQIDALAAALETDIAYEMGSWSSPTSWQANVSQMRDFAIARPAYMRQHIVDFFALRGTAVFTFNPPSQGNGRLAVNGRLLPTTPWEGAYFQNSTVRVTAVPDPGYQFIGWAEGDQAADFSLTVSEPRSFTPLFEPAPANQPQPGDVVIQEVHVDDDGRIQGDWFTLRVVTDRADLRGWRITDNDSKTATDEGSLILPDDPALAQLPAGTTLLIAATATVANDQWFATASPAANTLIFYAGDVGEARLDGRADPWFNLGRNDNLVLLAPGDSAAFADDVGIDFVTVGEPTAITPATFGILADGVTPEETTPASLTIINENGTLIFLIALIPIIRKIMVICVLFLKKGQP